MAARMLTLLLLTAPVAALSADCVGTECPAEADDSVSLLAHRASSGSSASSRRRGGCSQETGSMTTLEPLGATPSAFSAVTVQGDVEVNLVVAPGSASNVEVLVDSGLASYVDVSVSQGMLSITFSPPCGDVDEDPKVKVTSPSLPTTISASDDAAVNFPMWPFALNPTIEATVQSMSLSATSDAKIQLKKVQVDGTLEIATDLDGQVDTQWTVSPMTQVSASGDSQVQGGTTTELQVSISLDSQVKYYVEESASGSVTDDSQLKIKVPQGASAPDYSGVTTDSSSTVRLDW